MLDEACEQHELTDESEVRFITRPDHQHPTEYSSVDCSMTSHVATIAPDPSNGPPADRRFGAGVLLLAEECVMRCTPQNILDQLDW